MTADSQNAEIYQADNSAAVPPARSQTRNNGFFSGATLQLLFVSLLLFGLLILAAIGIGIMVKRRLRPADATNRVEDAVEPSADSAYELSRSIRRPEVGVFAPEPEAPAAAPVIAATDEADMDDFDASEYYADEEPLLAYDEAEALIERPVAQAVSPVPTPPVPVPVIPMPQPQPPRPAGASTPVAAMPKSISEAVSSGLSSHRTHYLPPSVSSRAARTQGGPRLRRSAPPAANPADPQPPAAVPGSFRQQLQQTAQ
jgi:hypothetical protein